MKQLSPFGFSVTGPNYAPARAKAEVNTVDDINNWFEVTFTGASGETGTARFKFTDAGHQLHVECSGAVVAV
jgi:hypothetical protein